MQDSEYDKIVNDINEAFERLKELSEGHSDVINMLGDLWAEHEQDFYETLDIRPHHNSPSIALTHGQRRDRFNQQFKDFMDSMTNDDDDDDN
jgi:hypothetical protein